MAKKKQRGRSFWQRMLIVVPVLLSAATLVFGIYQYFDKKSIESDNAKLTKLLNELNIQKEIRENRKGELEVKDGLEMQYIDAELLDLYTSLGQTDIGGEIHFKGPISDAVFDAAFNRWLTHLEEHLKIKLNLLKTNTYRDLKAGLASLNTQKSFMSLFLVRNSGKFRLKDAAIKCTTLPENKEYPITLGDILPGEGYIFITGRSDTQTLQPYGIRLVPGREMTYHSEFESNNSIEFKIAQIRKPYEVQRILAPGIQWAH